MMATYLKPSRIKRLVHEHGKRVSHEYVEALDRYIAHLVEQSLAMHNGSKKTLDATVLAFVTGKLK